MECLSLLLLLYFTAQQYPSGNLRPGTASAAGCAGACTSTSTSASACTRTRTGSCASTGSSASTSASAAANDLRASWPVDGQLLYLDRLEVGEGETVQAREIGIIPPAVVCPDDGAGLAVVVEDNAVVAEAIDDDGGLGAGCGAGRCGDAGLEAVDLAHGTGNSGA